MSDGDFTYTFTFTIKSPLEVKHDQLQELIQGSIALLTPYIEKTLPSTPTLVEQISELFE